MKFGRIYELIIQGANDTHVFKLPTTLRFDVTRNTLAECNEAKLTLYNLNPSSRKDIYLDRILGYKEYRSVRLRAGYASETSMPLIFRGNASTEYSERVGADIMTQIAAKDGMFAVANSFVSLSRPAGWNFASVATEVMKTMKNASPGTVTPQTVQSNRGVVFNGSSWSALQSLASTNYSQIFIDNETVNLLTGDGTISDATSLKKISSATGLIGIPRIIGEKTLVTMVFEPNLSLGSPVELTSTLNTAANGPYKVIGFHHYGIISGVESGQAFTDLELSKFGSRINQ